MEYGRLLFNVGVTIIVCCVLSGILSVIVLRVKYGRLNARLNEEYGEKKKKHRPSR